MPFKSEKQRRWMYANKPEMAKKWAKNYKDGGLVYANSGEDTFDVGLDDWTDSTGTVDRGLSGLDQLRIFTVGTGLGIVRGAEGLADLLFESTKFILGEGFDLSAVGGDDWMPAFLTNLEAEMQKEGLGAELGVISNIGEWVIDPTILVTAGPRVAAKIAAQAAKFRSIGIGAELFDQAIKQSDELGVPVRVCTGANTGGLIVNMSRGGVCAVAGNSRIPYTDAQGNPLDHIPLLTAAQKKSLSRNGFVRLEDGTEIRRADRDIKVDGRSVQDVVFDLETGEVIPGSIREVVAEATGLTGAELDNAIARLANGGRIQTPDGRTLGRIDVNPQTGRTSTDRSISGMIGQSEAIFRRYGLDAKDFTDEQIREFATYLNGLGDDIARRFEAGDAVQSPASFVEKDHMIHQWLKDNIAPNHRVPSNDELFADIFRQHKLETGDIMHWRRVDKFLKDADKYGHTEWRTAADKWKRDTIEANRNNPYYQGEGNSQALMLDAEWKKFIQENGYNDSAEALDALTGGRGGAQSVSAGTNPNLSRVGITKAEADDAMARARESGEPVKVCPVPKGNTGLIARTAGDRCITFNPDGSWSLLGSKQRADSKLETVTVRDQLGHEQVYHGTAKTLAEFFGVNPDTFRRAKTGTLPDGQAFTKVDDFARTLITRYVLRPDGEIDEVVGNSWEQVAKQLGADPEKIRESKNVAVYLPDGSIMRQTDEFTEAEYAKVARGFEDMSFREEAYKNASPAVKREWDRLRIVLKDLSEILGQRKWYTTGDSVGHQGKFDRDHVNSLATGGEHIPENWQVLFWTRNRSKGANSGLDPARILESDIERIRKLSTFHKNQLVYALENNDLETLNFLLDRGEGLADDAASYADGGVVAANTKCMANGGVV